MNSKTQGLPECCRLVRTLVIAAFMFVSTSVASAQENYSNFIAFGDSLSDTGNLASTIPFNFPFPFFDNRISDDKVAIDHLAESLNYDARASEVGGFNFSVAGGNILGGDLEDLASQVDSYLARVNQIADPQALFFIMVGGNDLRDLRSELSESSAGARIDLIVSKFISEISRLEQAGATRFMIANVANIGRIPETLEREINEPGIGLRATGYVEEFNLDLAFSLNQLQQSTGIELVEYDLYAEFESILDAPQNFNFTNSTQACFDIGEVEDAGDVFGLFDAFHPDCELGTRFDRFVFFDKLHPTGATNFLIGTSMIERLSSVPPIVEPPKKINLPFLIMLLLDD